MVICVVDSNNIQVTKSLSLEAHTGVVLYLPLNSYIQEQQSDSSQASKLALV